MAASAKLASSASEDASAASSIRSTTSSLVPPAFSRLSLDANGDVVLRVPLNSLPSVSAETGHTPQMIFERLCGYLVKEADKLKIKLAVCPHSSAPVMDKAHHQLVEAKFSAAASPGTKFTADDVRKLEECLASCWSQLSEEYDAAVLEKVARANGDAVQGASS